MGEFVIGMNQFMRHIENTSNMMNFVYKDVLLISPSFLQKLLKQQPEENAVIELNNLLANNTILEIDKSEIERIESKYGFKLIDEFKLNLEEFYATYLNYCLSDHNLSEHELHELDHLRSILSLHSKTVKSLHNKIGVQVYKKSFEEAVADGLLSKEEEELLQRLEKVLDLPENVAERISKDVSSTHVKNYIGDILKRQLYSPKQEEVLNQMLKSLKIDFEFDKKTIDLLKLYKQYWFIEKGDLPVLFTDVVLQKEEHCYYKTQIDWYETRRDVWTLIDSGPLYVTSKRLLFMGRSKNTNIRLDKILSVTQHSDGIEIDKDAGKVPILKPRPNELIVMEKIIKRVLREKR